MTATTAAKNSPAKASAGKKKKTSKVAATRKKKLVIVESPSKAKTIGKFLGSSYKVIASVGHVRDLPKSKLGIDIEDNFEPQYISIRGKGDIIKELKKEAKKASKVYLATDPDREGEAISWHLAYLLGIDPAEECRIEFNEITKSTIREAIKHPRAIDQNLVDAQQARRVLDRLVGYEISPILWRKVKRGLSAGRVQSAALKIICDREKEIRAFVPEEYWTVTADFRKQKVFRAKLTKKDGKELTIHNAEEKDRVMRELEKNPYIITKIEKSERQYRPKPPFTTSSLQQDASNRLNFNTRRTMQIAQALYEGVNVRGRGTVGLITYLRTDSVRVSAEARAAAKTFILDSFGEEYYSDNKYGNKKKAIQDSHEAIRPADVTLTPEEIRDSLTPEQFKLYQLIWQRFMASQMSPSRIHNVQAAITNGAYTFSASGSRMLFDGFRKVYADKPGDEKDKMLPELEEGEQLTPKKVDAEQNFSKPKARYSEAALIKELESRNIGRPSTYAPIVTTLTGRRYVKREKKSLVPTELGEIVDDLMEQYFKDIVDSRFTAEMEDKLDDIEATGSPWKKVISEFYTPFEKELEKAEHDIPKVELEDRPSGEICEVCGRPMVIKSGRFGDFLACSGYPECKNTKPVPEDEIKQPCPKCGSKLVKRVSKKGNKFYGCSNYPNCDFASPGLPTGEICKECGSYIISGLRGRKYCMNSECPSRKKYKKDTKSDNE